MVNGEWLGGGGITALLWRNVVKIFDKGCKEGDQRTTSIGKSISQSDNRVETTGKCKESINERILIPRVRGETGGDLGSPGPRLFTKVRLC